MLLVAYMVDYYTWTLVNLTYLRWMCGRGVISKHTERHRRHTEGMLKAAVLLHILPTCSKMMASTALSTMATRFTFVLASAIFPPHTPLSRLHISQDEDLDMFMSTR